jgi:hypothetical protein
VSEDLRQAVEALRTWSGRLEGDVADLAAVVQEVRDELSAAGAQAGAPGDDRPRDPVYATTAAWLAGWYVPVVLSSRHVGQAFRWCPRWFEHPEAVLRLDALHRGWEVARHDVNRGMLIWLRDADAQLRELTSADGPFTACLRGHNTPQPPHIETLPDDWYDPSAMAPLRDVVPLADAGAPVQQP